MINPISFSQIVKANKTFEKQNNNIFFSPLKDEVILEKKKNNIINVRTVGNTSYVSFKGKLNNPEEPSIQMKVSGVTRHQSDMSNPEFKPVDTNVEDLANSKWYDGKHLSYEIKQLGSKNRILLYDKDFGELGRVPSEITEPIIKLLNENKGDYEFTLSNVVAGMTKGAQTIGLRVNLICTSDDEKVKNQSKDVFEKLLSSTDVNIADAVMHYQEESSPEEVLEKIFKVTEEKHGKKAVEDVKSVIHNIANEINDKSNKNILLVGHCIPDGDTLGCILGMEAAIKSNYPDKNIDCAVDDKLPGLYRDKLPNIDKIKMPYDKESIKNLEQAIEEAKKLPQTAENCNKIQTYKNEIARLSNKDNYFDLNAVQGEKHKDYDLVILMDVPSPSRFTDAFKPYLENAKKVIYIDHHPNHFASWNDAKEVTGLDMEKVEKDKLSLIVREVPAATELVTVIAKEAGLLEQLFAKIDNAKQFVAGVVSGTSSDTSAFRRTANYSPEDINSPVSQRPNFLPEGLSKWLISKLGNRIDKKWLRENIVYDISDNKGVDLQSAREKMVNCAKDACKVYPEIGFGVVSVSYDDLCDIWESAKKDDKNVTFVDVQNSFKYSEVMNSLRESAKIDKNGVAAYQTVYDDDKIAILILQDKAKGEITENSEISDTNGLRLSLRSQSGTNYAELLSYMFNGGGHASAAGGRIEFPNVTINSKVGVKIDGKLQSDPYEILYALNDNYDVKHNSQIAEKDKGALLHSFEIVEMPKNGSTVQDLIADVVSALRANSEE